METPGTAPGSATLIPHDVYHHSRKRHHYKWHIRPRVSRGSNEAADMSQRSQHAEDPYAWSQTQAELLRRLSGHGAALPNDLDLEHIIEEIEALGGERLYKVESHLLQALIHLIKLAALPGSPDERGWNREVRAFLDTARRRYRPSMRRNLDLEAIWRDAVRSARRDFAEDALPVPPLPERCPFALDELLDEDASPRDLAPRIGRG